MTHFICTACGTQFAETAEPPAACPICEDERQFVPESGQQWTDLSALRAGHKLEWKKVADGVHALQVAPHFAIGQRAFFIERPQGNILWDCLALVDEESVARIKAAGGLSAIAISHPHFYTTNAEWSAAFGGVPVHLHTADRHWVQRPHENIRHWQGERLEIAEGATLVRCDGHFPGSAVLHVADGDGMLFTGDTLQVVPDRRHVSFMYSYPNIIPLPAEKVRQITEAIKPFRYDAIFGGFAGRTIGTSGMEAVEVSARRYIAAITG